MVESLFHFRKRFISGFLLLKATIQRFTENRFCQHYTYIYLCTINENH